MPVHSPTSPATPVLAGPDVQLPAGDWTIAFDVTLASFLASSGYNGNAIFALGSSDTVCSAPNTMVLATHDVQSITNGQFAKCMTLTGVDHAGNRLGHLNGSGHMGQTGTIKMLTPGSVDVFNDRPRTMFLVKSGADFVVYSAGEGQDVHEVARRRPGAWLGFDAPVRLTLLSARRADGTGTLGGRRVHLGRFLVAHKAVTLTEMRRIANGANPVTLLSLTAPSLYWPLDNTTALSNTAVIADVIQGATLTSGTTGWQAPSASSLTQTVEADFTARVHCPWEGHVYQPTAFAGGTIPVQGSYSTPNAARTVDIQLRAVETASPFNEVQGWQTVATNVTAGNSAAGTWAGSYSIDAAQRWLRWQIRAVINGVAQPETLVRSTWGVGVVVCTTGQSIVKLGLGVDGIGQVSHPYHSVHMPWSSDTDGDQNFREVTGAAARPVSGAGMGRIASALSDALGCCVLTSCPAKSGASIGSFVQAGSLNMATAIRSMNLTKAKVLLWNQGNSVLPATGASYEDDLEALYTQFQAGIGHAFTFLVMPVGNEFNASQSANTLTNYRRLTMQWVRTSRALGRDVVFAGGIMDGDLVDTTHLRNTLAGNGIYAGRIAQSMLNVLNPALPSGAGPAITACVWNGGSTITVKVRHNAGGTALKTVENFNNTNLTTYPAGVGPINNGANCTGFAVGRDLVRDPGGSGGLANGISISSSTITGADEITLVLAAVPTKAPYVTYLEGKPGFDAGSSISAIQNLVYDDFAVAVVPTKGRPLEPTFAPIRCIPLAATVLGGVATAPGGVAIPLVGGWGVHPQGELVTPVA